MSAMYGKDNPHPRGLIGEIVANSLLSRGWHEEDREGAWGLTEHVWVKGDVVTTLEWAHEIEFAAKENHQKQYIEEQKAEERE